MNLKHLSSNVTCYFLTKLRLWWGIMIYRLLVRIYSNFTLNGYKIAVCESKTIHFGIYDSRWFSWKWFKKFFSLSTFVLRSKTNDWWNKWYFLPKQNTLPQCKHALKIFCEKRNTKYFTVLFVFCFYCYQRVILSDFKSLTFMLEIDTKYQSVFCF